MAVKALHLITVASQGLVQDQAHLSKVKNIAPAGPLNQVATTTMKSQEVQAMAAQYPGAPRESKDLKRAESDLHLAQERNHDPEPGLGHSLEIKGTRKDTGNHEEAATPDLHHHHQGVKERRGISQDQEVPHLGDQGLVVMKEQGRS